MRSVSQNIDATGPVREGAELGKENRAPVRFDKRALVDSAVSANELEFFQPDPTRNLNRNYRDNPFQGNDRKKVIGVGLYLAPPVIVTDEANNIDARAITESLQHSAVTLGKGNRETTIHRLHTKQVEDFAESELVTEFHPTDGSEYEAYKLNITPGAILHDQDMILEADQRFHFTLHLPSGYALPTEGDWDASEQFAVKLGALIQYERLGA